VFLLAKASSHEESTRKRSSPMDLICDARSTRVTSRSTCGKPRSRVAWRQRGEIGCAGRKPYKVQTETRQHIN